MMGPGFYPNDPYSGEQDYDVDKLREAAGIEEENVGPHPNYECQTCGNCQYVDDHKQHAPNWCEECESVKSFKRLKSE